MAAVPAEVGLRLLLCPLPCNVVVQTACPLRVKTKLSSKSGSITGQFMDLSVLQKYLLTNSSPEFIERATLEREEEKEFRKDVLSYLFPLYYHVKFAFLVWLQLPTIGAGQLYMNHLRPFLLRHQAVLDRMVSLVYGEIAKFIIVNQAELQFVRTAAMKLLSRGNQMLRDIFRPIGRQENRTIGGPRRQIQGVESEEDD